MLSGRTLSWVAVSVVIAAGLAIVLFNPRCRGFVFRARRYLLAVLVAMFLIATVVYALYDSSRPNLKTAHLCLLSASSVIILTRLWWRWKRDCRVPLLNAAQVNVVFACLAFLLIPALVYTFWPASDERPLNLGNSLSFIFGVASWGGLLVSLLVFISLRRILRLEEEIIEEATLVIQSARTSLAISVLSPNVGLQPCILKGKVHLFENYAAALLKKIDQLKSNGGHVTMTYLGPRQLATFYKQRKMELTGFKTDASLFPKYGDKRYEEETEEFMKRLETLLTGNSIILKQWKEDCLDLNSDNFPPLSMIIADEKAAVIFYNAGYLDANVTDLRGMVYNDNEEVKSFKYLHDIYLKHLSVSRIGNESAQ